MKKRVWAILLTAALLAPQAAHADETSFGVQLAGTHGTHRESEGTVTAPLVPVPIVTASHRFGGCFEAAVEGLPPIGPIRIANNGLGMQDIALTYVDASLRYWNRNGTLGVGIGDTLYNQRTNFARMLDATHKGTELDHSRVAGTRYEILGRLPLGTRDEVRGTLGLNPAMHGRYSYTVHVTNGSRTTGFASPDSWERASQVDANVRFVHYTGNYALSYGVRYLNYTAAYTHWPAPSFADANSLFMPYVGVQRFFGPAPAQMHRAVNRPCLARGVRPRIDAFAGVQIASGAHHDGFARTSNTAARGMPLLQLRARQGRYELFAEGSPAVHAFSGDIPHAPPGVRYDIAVGYAAAGARYWSGRGGLGLGVGDALYTSRSRLGGRTEIAVRAAGLRYELLQRIALGRSRLTLDLAEAPRMHERLTSWIDGTYTAFTPEFGTGSLLDASAAFETPMGARHAWLYGLRYLNYTGALRRGPFQGPQEQTRLFTAFAAWGFAVGP